MNVRYIKPFIQPSVGYSNQFLEVAITHRLAFVSFTDRKFELNDPQYNTDVEIFFNRRRNTIVFEPGVTARVGYRNVKMQFQYSISTFPYDEELDANVNAQSILLGVHVLLGGRFKKVIGF